MFKEFIFDVILFGPKKADFPTYRLLCKSAQMLGLDSFCFNELPFRVQSRTMAGQFSAHIWTSITAGFILAFPYVLYEFWKFVSPGLHQNERKTARGFILVASLLFFLGLDKKVKNLSHHTLFFDVDFDAHAAEIYDDPKWPEEPLFYANFPSITDPSMAPKGKEACFLLIPIAPGLEDSPETVSYTHLTLPTKA